MTYGGPDCGTCEMDAQPYRDQRRLDCILGGCAAMHGLPADCLESAGLELPTREPTRLQHICAEDRLGRGRTVTECAIFVINLGRTAVRSDRPCVSV